MQQPLIVMQQVRQMVASVVMAMMAMITTLMGMIAMRMKTWEWQPMAKEVVQRQQRAVTKLMQHNKCLLGTALTQIFMGIQLVLLAPSYG